VRGKVERLEVWLNFLAATDRGRPPVQRRL